MNIFYNILGYVGFWGPYILFLVSIGILFKGPVRLLGAYVIGQMINMFINYIAKDIIKEPRPSGDRVHYFTWNSLEDHYRVSNTMGVQEYGMPSGHAQSVSFSFIFMLYVLKMSWIVPNYGCLSIITIIQRVIYENHSIKQVFIGCIIGGLLGYLTWAYIPRYVGKLERYFTDRVYSSSRDIDSAA